MRLDHLKNPNDDSDESSGTLSHLEGANEDSDTTGIPPLTIDEISDDGDLLVTDFERPQVPMELREFDWINFGPADLTEYGVGDKLDLIVPATYLVFGTEKVEFEGVDPKQFNLHYGYIEYPSQGEAYDQAIRSELQRAADLAESNIVAEDNSGVREITESTLNKTNPFNSPLKLRKQEFHDNHI